MTTLLPHVRERAPLLLSSTQWAQKQALSYLSSIYEENFAVLTQDQKRLYPQLSRRYQLALEALDYELSTVRDTFKATHIAHLKRELKTLLGIDIDPEQARIFTRYRENIEEDFVEYLTRIGGGQRSDREARFTFSPSRTRRAVDESKFREHVRSVSLWEAACENFSYRTDAVLLKPFSYEQASYIDYNSDLQGHPAGPFIAIVRRLDLGTQLKAALNAAIGTSGPLTQSTWAVARAAFEFDLLEALRNYPVSKVIGKEHAQLFSMLKGRTASHIWPVSMGLNKKSRLVHPPTPTGANGPLLFGEEDPYDYVWRGEVPLALFIIKVDQESGVFSYFPQRLGGALLWHKDVPTAFAHFRHQLQHDHSQGQLGWFMRQLPLKHIGYFSQLLSKEPRPEGLTWLAGVMYDGFKGVFPEPDLTSLQLYVEMSERRPLPLAQVITLRQLERYESNLSQLATSKSERDWQAFREALSDVGSEVLGFLTTPVPGGVLGLNAIMQTAVFGSLTVSFLQGVKEALKGEATTFASAMADTADLLINARLIGVAAKAHRQRLHTLWNTLGQPRKITRQDGTDALWHPNLDAYTHLDISVLDNLTPTDEGLYELNGKLFAKVQEGVQIYAVEVTYDMQGRHYVLETPRAHSFKPPVTFEPTRQVWYLSLEDTQSLDDKGLLQRMLPVDTPASALFDIARILTVTATSREQLDAVWQGEAVPGPLADGVRRFMADQLIDQIISELPVRGEMPLNADSAVFAVLTQLPGWPAHTLLDVFNQQGQLIETYGKDYRAGTALNRVEVKRRDHGAYVARNDVTYGSAQVEQLFGLILDQLPETATVGHESNPDLSRSGRIASLREQIANAAQEARPLLFKALTGLHGHQRSDPVASSDSARKYLPLLYPPVSETTSPLLAKLHELNSSLSIECLEPLLAAHPFNAREISAALAHNTQPLSFANAADRLKIKLRVDQALDGIYHRRAYTRDSDLWMREFARGVLQDSLNRRLVILEASGSTPMPAYIPTGPNDTSVVLIHYGKGTYEVMNVRDGGSVTFSSTPDSFLLALSWFLPPQERQKLGMEGASVAGLRQTLGDAMHANRQANGDVSLWDTTTVQYERKILLSAESSRNELGLYEIHGKTCVSLYGAVYEVAYDATVHKWRMVHPEIPGVNTPILEHNYHGAWRQKIENPLQWSGLQLLRRLRAEPITVSDEVGNQIMEVSNISEGVLRQVHMNTLTPPPLLMDTWKRFKIQQDIKGFVKNLQAHHTLADARSDFQLLLIQSLPGWPRDKVLQIVDDQGATLAEYGADHDSATPRIRLSIDATRNGGFLRAVLMNLNEVDTHALLGEYNPIIEGRMLALGKKIADHALKRESELFASIYERQEHSTNPHVELIQSRFPQLPVSVIELLIQHTSGPDRENFFDKGMVPPRFSEQVQWTEKEVRLVRAYEGLYLGATATTDSNKLALHTLPFLPGWPGDLRIEVRRETANGDVLDSIGSSDAPHLRILVLRGWRYRAHSTDGQPLNPESVYGNNLLSSMLHALEPAQRTAMEVNDVSDTHALNEKIKVKALEQRASMTKILGLEPPSSRRKPPIEVNTSFYAYPITITLNESSHPLDLVRQVQVLYPLNHEAAIAYLDRVGGTESTRREAVAALRSEFDTMLSQLDAWAQIQLYQTGTSHMGMALPGHRNEVRNRIIRAWRKETPRVQGPDGRVGHVLDLSGFDVGDLPSIAGDFSHVMVLNMNEMRLRTGSNEFLSRFTQLLSLSMTNNRLLEVPAATGQMPQLGSLDLSSNRVVLSAEGVQQLAGLSTLVGLFLNFNPLTLAPDVSQMANLKILELQRTGLTQWPAGLLGLTQLERVNLQYNEISTVPPEVFNVPEPFTVNRAIRLAGNPVNDHSRDLIIDYWVRTGISFGYTPALAHAMNLAQAEARAGDAVPWLAQSLRPEQRQAKAQQWALLSGFGEQSNSFFKMLDFFTVDQAKMTSQAWNLLTDRVWILIDQMLADSGLRDLLFKAIVYENRTCGDGAMVLMENLEVQALIHHAQSRATEDQLEAELFKLAKQLFRLRQVDDHAELALRQILGTGARPDIAEVQLLFRVLLVDTLNLPTQTREMIYLPVVSNLTPQVIEVGKAILAMDGNPAFMHSIMQEQFWRDFLKTHYADRFEAIETEFQRAYQQLSEEAGLSSELELQRGQELVMDRDQKLNRLVEELTQQAYQAAVSEGSPEPTP